MLTLLLTLGCSKATQATTPGVLADVQAVAVSGEDGAWRFDVTVLSPDVDCSQYADWWEVLTEDGALVYRRILNHSHPDEQPFTRDGSPVPVAADQVVIVRAHLSPGGYGGAALKGTAGGDFVGVELAEGFAEELAETAPLPEDCWY